MSFKDQNGKITIDEEEAGKDIRSLKKICEFLSRVEEKISSIRLQAQDFRGDTGTVIVEQCENLLRTIGILIQETEESSLLIKSTVEKYEQIDRDLKILIEKQRG